MNHYSASSTGPDDKLVRLLKSLVRSVYLGLEAGLLTLQVNSLRVNQLQLILYKVPHSWRTTSKTRCQSQCRITIYGETYQLPCCYFFTGLFSGTLALGFSPKLLSLFILNRLEGPYFLIHRRLTSWRSPVLPCKLIENYVHTHGAKAQAEGAVSQGLSIALG